MGRSLGLSVGLLVGLIAACTPKVPSELLKAREAYASASEGAAATMVPAELHKAHGALMEAEAAFKVDPTGYKTLDLAYIAQRKAQLANALASHANQDANTVAANAQYQATQDAIMANTRAELGSSKSDLAASQSAGALTAAQLQTSELARATAEKRANDAVGALARLAAVKEESRGLVITLSGSVLFRSDEATLLPEALKRLEGVTDALMETKERTILIEGHTDSQGSDAYNIDLSQRRAESVRSFLTARGYEPSRIRAVGIGEARPVAGNNTAEGRANNRRVEIVIEPSVTAAQ
jgi:outer membrane protein OmpA-like peptidoglycan-associated protein